MLLLFQLTPSHIEEVALLAQGSITVASIALVFIAAAFIVVVVLIALAFIAAQQCAGGWR
ncbi:MAG: hypothetical protein ACXWKP_25565 [Bradyrhizobium sp.]